MSDSASSGEQLELFADTPFALRLPVPEALRLFWMCDWQYTAKAKVTKGCFRVIAAFFASRYVDEISKADIEAFRRHLTDLGFQANTANTYHGIITRLYNWLYTSKEAGIVNGQDLRRITLPKKNPASQVPKVNEDQFRRGIAWPKKLVQRVIGACTHLGDEPLANVIEAAYLTKLRLGDVARITTHNVDLARKILSGVQNKSKRRSMPGGRPYLLSISPRLEAIFRLRLEKVPAGDPLFRDARLGVEAWRRDLNRRFQPVRTLLNAPHVQLRDFRPSAATLLLDNGVDVETVRESFGWSTLRMVPVYARRTMAHQRKAQELLEDGETEILL